MTTSFILTSLVLLGLTDLLKGQVIVVEEHPLSLLVPTREVATFTCKAFCDPNCCGDWLINGVGHHQNRLDFEQKGYTFHNDTTGSVHIMNMSVNASFMLNNTKIRCHFMHCGDSGFSVNSDIATLLVIENSPVLSNPMISMKNSTSLTVSWSPPFLWPGHRIEHYDILFVRQGIDRDITFHRESGNYTSEVVAVTMDVQNLSKILMCSELMVCILATTAYPSPVLKICVRDFPHSPQNGFNSPRINASVLFDANASPLVYANIQLPHSICDHWTSNYSLTVEDKEGDVITRLGPKPHHGSDAIREILTLPNLSQNEVYSLTVRIDSRLETDLSTSITFNATQGMFFKESRPTTNPLRASGGDLVTYQVGMGLSLGIAVMLLTALLFTLIIVCVNYSKNAKERRCVRSRDRVCKAMVLNPIYSGDGPVYDSIQPQIIEPDPQLEAKLLSDASNQHYELLRNANDDQSSSTARYIGQPIHSSQSNPFILSTGSCSIDGDPESGQLIRSSSLSLPATYTTKVVALKPNGQPRNKLNLTLDLSENLDSPTPAPTRMCEDDPYTVMKPAGSLRRQQREAQPKKNITGNNIL